MIESIRTYSLRQALKEPFGFSQWYYQTRKALLVEIVDHSGAVGWGECYGPAEVNQSAVDTLYAPLLIGWDPLRNEAAWQHGWRHSLDFARRGVLMGALSGIDMALMDLKGRLLGVSVSELMGGRVREEVPCYATGMYFREQPEEVLMETILGEAQAHWEGGFRALKIKIGKNPSFDRHLIDAMRETFPEAQLMADSNHGYSLSEAISMGRRLSEADYAWFEEPLHPDLVNQFRQLSDAVTVPIATGECEQTRWGFQTLLETGGVQVAQPDLAYCGGPSEGLKIRAIASSLGVSVVPHCWGTQLNLACTTHFNATTVVEPGRLEAAEPTLELDRTENPLRDDMYAVPVDVDQGTARVPTGPGLGVEVDRKAMERFCVQETECR